MIPPYGLTLEEHRALMEHRTRPLTDAPIQLRTVSAPSPGSRTTLMDWVLAQVEAGAL